MLGYMVECGGTWWKVLGYMVESVVLLWGMLDYMEGSVGLPGDSPIRQQLFNTGWEGGGGGGFRENMANNPENMKLSNPHLTM